MRVKICGLRRIEDVDAAVAAGADAVGFVFAESIRRVTPDEARPLIERVPPGILKVGVLRGSESGPLQELAKLGLDAVQIEHTPHENPSIPAGLAVWWVLTDSEALEERAALVPPDQTLLIDSARGGGSSESANLDRVARLSARRPLILAGGLDPDNVAGAIHKVRPCGVDVSSGVESSPGIKDPARIHAFVRAARAAAATLPQGAITPCP